MTLDRVLVRKAAQDAGFDLEDPPDGAWARFGISGQPLTAWVRPLAAGFQLALSARKILDELEAGDSGDQELPGGAAGCVHAASYQSLMATLSRARILDATLPTRLYDSWQAQVNGLTTTERDVLAKQRVGQDLFREGLFAYWRGRCAVTGIEIPELLRASHIKPWRDCADAERLDIHNGLLLAAHLDALFDAHLLSFGEQGEAIWAATASPALLDALGLALRPLRIQGLSAGHHAYLQGHRAELRRLGEGRART